MHQFYQNSTNGIGVCDAETAKHTYKHLFGMDVLILMMKLKPA
jgi:hypothetical protein